MYSDDLLVVARRYAQARDIAMTTLGTYAAGDGKFFGRLAEGRVTIRRAKAVGQYLSDHWPDGLEWPPSIPRPEPSGDSGGAA